MKPTASAQSEECREGCDDVGGRLGGFKFNASNLTNHIKNAGNLLIASKIVSQIRGVHVANHLIKV